MSDRDSSMPTPKLCECGCGNPVLLPLNRFRRGHNNKQGIPARPNAVLTAKRCTRCGETFPATTEFFYRKTRRVPPPNPWSYLHSTCKVCSNKQWSFASPEEKDRIRKSRRVYYNAGYREIRAAKDKANRWALRAEMVAAYGGKCNCCGETELAFLTLEHVNRDARQHRESLGKNSCGQYIWQDLKRRGWPKDGYTVLCYNCNCSTARGETCPHKLQQLQQPQ